MTQVPSATVMAQAAKVAIEQDRPVYLDYYNDSLEKKCCIGVQGNTKEKAYLVITENSLYIVSAEIPVKRIVSSSESTPSSS